MTASCCPCIYICVCVCDINSFLARFRATSSEKTLKAPYKKTPPPIGLSHRRLSHSQDPDSTALNLRCTNTFDAGLVDSQPV